MVRPGVERPGRGSGWLPVGSRPAGRPTRGMNPHGRPPCRHGASVLRQVSDNGRDGRPRPGHPEKRPSRRPGNVPGLQHHRLPDGRAVAGTRAGPTNRGTPCAPRYPGSPLQHHPAGRQRPDQPPPCCYQLLGRLRVHHSLGPPARPGSGAGKRRRSCSATVGVRDGPRPRLPPPGLPLLPRSARSAWPTPWSTRSADRLRIEYGLLLVAVPGGVPQDVVGRVGRAPGHQQGALQQVAHLVRPHPEHAGPDPLLDAGALRRPAERPGDPGGVDGLPRPPGEQRPVGARRPAAGRLRPDKVVAQACDGVPVDEGRVGHARLDPGQLDGDGALAEVPGAVVVGPQVADVICPYPS